jgi:predicted PurR-regulated permease PerM
MDFNPEKRKKTALWIIGVAAACILIFLGLQNIAALGNAFKKALDLLMPLLLGIGFALILNVPMLFFERILWPKAKKKVAQKLRRPAAFILSLLVVFGILVGVIWLIIPELINAVTVVIQTVLDLAKQLSGMDEQQIAELPLGSLLLSTDWDGLLLSLQQWLKEEGGNLMNTAMGTIGSVLGGIFDLFIAIVFATYLLFTKDRLKNQACRLARAWLPPRWGEWSIHAASVTAANFRNFVAGQSLEAVILGSLCLIGMLIFRIPYAMMVSVLVGVTALVPVVGAFIGAIVGGFIILTESPVKALIFIIFLIILQQLEGNIIYPKVMGNRVNLPAMWILAAVTIGGGISGPIGMLLSVPLAATAYTLIKEATLQREIKNAERV